MHIARRASPSSYQNNKGYSPSSPTGKVNMPQSIVGQKKDSTTSLQNSCPAQAFPLFHYPSKDKDLNPSANDLVDENKKTLKRIGSLEAGVGINDVRGSYYEQATPLIEAILSNRADYAEKLIQAGAHVNFRNESAGHCSTPLQVALSYDRWEHVKLLLKAGADINLLDPRFSTPLSCYLGGGAVKRVEDVKFLIEHGAHVTDNNSVISLLPRLLGEKDGPKIVELLIEGGLDLNKYRDGNLFSYFTYQKQKDTIKFLIDHGLDIKKANSDSLVIAVNNKDIEIARMLLEAGSDPNQTYNGSYRPRNKALNYAVERNFVDYVHLLLLHDANIKDAFNEIQGTSSYDIAKKNNYKEITKILEKERAAREAYNELSVYKQVTAKQSVDLRNLEASHKSLSEENSVLRVVSGAAVTGFILVLLYLRGDLKIQRLGEFFA